MELPSMRFYGVPENHLPPTSSVLAVCAHPDDESFGLGAALSSWAEEGTQTSVLCFTHGEASTLGTADDNLHRLREKELAVAADELGVTTVRLLEYPDGRLIEEPIEQLSSELRRVVELVGASLLLVFDEGGITGHPDHMRATETATAVASDVAIPVLAWTLSEAVAARSSTMSSRQPSSGVEPRTSTWSSRSTEIANIGLFDAMPASPMGTPCSGVASSCKAIGRHSAGSAVEGRRGVGRRPRGTGPYRTESVAGARTTREVGD